jgi:hypothetical protein
MGAMTAGSPDTPAAEPLALGLDLRDRATRMMDEARYAQAEPLLRQALAIFEAELDPADPMRATTAHDLAVLCELSGSREEARALWDRARAAVEARPVGGAE